MFSSNKLGDEINLLILKLKAIQKVFLVLCQDNQKH